MGRTTRQNSRKRIRNFYRSCMKYSRGLQKAPPRLRITLPNWEVEAKMRGVDPKDVFDDFVHMPEAARMAKDIGDSTTAEAELNEMWLRHKWRIEYRNKRRKQELIEAIGVGDFAEADKLVEERDGNRWLTVDEGMKPEDRMGVERAIAAGYIVDRERQRAVQTIEDKEAIIKATVARILGKDV